jgi:hypothetical protein
MISGGAADGEDRGDETKGDKHEGTQHARDKIERAPSRALSTVHANDKGEEAPGSLEETRSPPQDKGVSSQPGHTNSLHQSLSLSAQRQIRLTEHGSPKMRELKIRMKMRMESAFPPHSSKTALRIMAKDQDHRPPLKRWLP